METKQGEKTELEKENERLKTAIEEKKKLLDEMEELKNREAIGGKAELSPQEPQADPEKEAIDAEVKKVMAAAGR